MGWRYKALNFSQIPSLPLLEAAAPDAEAFKQSGYTRRSLLLHLSDNSVAYSSSRQSRPLSMVSFLLAQPVFSSLF